MDATETGRLVRTYSYFDLTLIGYANASPLLSGVLTGVSVVLGIVCMCRFETAKRCARVRFVCSPLAVAFSLLPVLLGGAYMNAVSYLIAGLLTLGVGLQAVANRKDEA